MTDHHKFHLPFQILWYSGMFREASFQLLLNVRILVSPLHDLLYLSIGRLATYIIEQQFLIHKTTLYPYSTSSGF